MENKKMSTSKKVVISSIAIALLLIAYQIFSVFIWGVNVAERELSKYAKEILELDEKIECRYDWYNNRYRALNDLEFVLDYRKQSNTIFDEVFNQKEEEKVNLNYMALIEKMPDNLTLPTHITVWTEVSADNYDIKSQRLYLLSIFNTEELPEQDSFQKPADIAMDVISGLGGDYNFTGIQIIYFDKNGMFEIAVPADLLEPLTVEKLLANTKKQPEDRYPEDYIEWLSTIFAYPKNS